MKCTIRATEFCCSLNSYNDWVSQQYLGKKRKNKTSAIQNNNYHLTYHIYLLDLLKED